MDSDQTLFGADQRIIAGTVRKIRAEGFFMEDRQVVDVEITVVSDLPIGSLNHLAIKVMPPLEPETLKHLVIPT